MSDENTPPEKPKPKPRGLGKPFKKGEFDPRRSTGPANRTRDGKTVSGLARDFTEEALLKQVEIMRDPDAPVREVLRASELIIARGWGTATQTVDISASIKHQHEISTIDFTAISQEARIQLLSAVKLSTAEFDEVPDAQYSIAPPRETDASDD